MAASEAGASAVVLFERADTECFVIRKVGGLGREPLGVGVLSVICTPTPDEDDEGDLIVVTCQEQEMDGGDGVGEAPPTATHTGDGEAPAGLLSGSRRAAGSVVTGSARLASELVLRPDQGAAPLNVAVVLSPFVPVLKSSDRTYLFCSPAATYAVVLPLSIGPRSVASFEALLAENALYDDVTVQPDGSDGDESGDGDEIGDGQVSGSGSSSGGAAAAEHGGATGGPTAADRIEAGSKKASMGIRKGALMSRRGMRKAGRLFKSKVKKRDEEMVVHGAVNKSVLATKKQTGRAAKLSRGAIKGIEKACWSAGTIAAHQGGRAVAKVQSTGAYQSRFGGSGDDDEEDSARVAAFKRRVDQMADIGAASATGAVCIYESLLDAGKLMAAGAKEVTVDVVDHRYGEQAAELAGTVCDVVGDVAITAYNVNELATLGVTDIALDTLVEAVDYTANLDELLEGDVIREDDYLVRGDVGASFSSVHLVLRPRSLMYYARAGDAKPVGIFDLEDLTTCAVADVPGQTHCLQVSSRDKVWFVVCPGADLLRDWLMDVTRASHALMKH